MKNSKRLAILLLLSSYIHKISSFDPIYAKKYATLTFLKNRLLARLLFESAFTGNTDGILQAIKRGADLNVQDENGKTPLIVAVINKKQQVVEALLLAGAAVNVKDNSGNTVFQYSSKAQSDDMRSLLLRYMKS